MVTIKQIVVPFGYPALSSNSFFEWKLLLNFTQMAEHLQADIPVVKLLDVVEGARDVKSDADNSIYLVMEYFDRSLEDLLRKPSLITQEIADKIFYELSCALDFLRTANVVHRDIKPSSIQLTADYRVKLCDLGMTCISTPNTIRSVDNMSKDEISEELNQTILKRREAAENMSHLTTTRPYRSPEVILLEEYDFAIDIWAAGCTMYEVFAACSHQKEKPKVLFSTVNSYDSSSSAEAN
mmetsp:Transcript_19983/g.30741  ORF Transcript_19983/g.30741 Transcript_19983/m.30741 type:complete len:239 (-) Transcript_19983:340-1056(-)